MRKKCYFAKKLGMKNVEAQKFDNYLSNLLVKAKELINLSGLYTGSLFASERGWAGDETVQNYEKQYKEAKEEFLRLYGKTGSEFKAEFEEFLRFMDGNSPQIKSYLDHSGYVDFRQALAVLKNKSRNFTVEWAAKQVIDIYFSLKSKLL